ncbi:MAG TPA: SigE family RNA polymerase sigma factor [Acidimicrobiales bacterium]|nr:SigE family RNA polymerase sigma factor [Acidimicrobiales bacterium]
MTSFDERASELFTIAYRVAFRLIGVRAEAEDVAQETVARAYLRWGRVSPYADAWTARTASNLALDLLRRRSRPDQPIPSPGSNGQPERVDLVRALRQLPRRQRDVIVLRYIADLPEQAVADRLGCSVGTVKQHAHRALATLRTLNHLQPCEGTVPDV